MAIIYTAGPIAGCTWDQATDWRDWLRQQLPECDILSPMRGKDFLKKLKEIPEQVGKREAKHASEFELAITSQHAIVARDHWDVSRADVIFANLLPATGVGRPSIGTCFELAWAWYYRKPAVVVMQDDNPTDHLFVREAAYIVTPHLEDAVLATRLLLNLPPEGAL